MPPLDEVLALAEQDRGQLADIVLALEEVLGSVLIGAYLHGSAVLGGLHPKSDLDVLAITSREATISEKERIVDRMLQISGPYPPVGSLRPIELTVVVGSEVRPWRYPPQRDLQYGEWLREGFERRDPELLFSVEDSDLAVLCTMVLIADAALVGPAASRVIDPVPRADLLDTSLAEVPGLVAEIGTDTRNAVLTLARVWNTVVSGQVVAKDVAAEWALPLLPPEHRPVLARARDIYVGTHQEEWDDLLDALSRFAETIAVEIRRAASIEAS
jgi:streptomycin 3"-adenylyltransferase